MPRVRTALYLDFDNVFSGLTKLDPEAALLFAQNPNLWLDRLAESLTVDGPRRWLILRCYMNPSGYAPNPSTSERQYFSRFRDSLTRAGFEVVDCPRLTHTKNAADIRLVVDAIDALAARVRYEEFIVASGDSDMTPLLVRLRADDRRVTLLSPFDAVEALAAVADRLIDGQQLLELLQEGAVGPPEVPDSAGLTNGTDRGADFERFSEIIRTRYDAAEQPLNLAALGQDVSQELGAGAKAGGWFGSGTFARAIERLALPNLQLGTHHVWDTSRHTPPSETGPLPRPLPESVARVSGPLGVPRLPTSAWPAIAHVLAEYAASHHFNMTEATAWSRDRLENRGVKVGRAAVGFALRATTYGGRPLYADPSPTGDEVLQAVVSNILSRAAAAELELSAAEEAELRAWFRGSGQEVPARDVPVVGNLSD
jgi:uncharacterized LabA/DUF88 family protein